MTYPDIQSHYTDVLCAFRDNKALTQREAEIVREAMSFIFSYFSQVKAFDNTESNTLAEHYAGELYGLARIPWAGHNGELSQEEQNYRILCDRRPFV